MSSKPARLDTSTLPPIKHDAENDRFSRARAIVEKSIDPASPWFRSAIVAALDFEQSERERSK